MFLLSHKTQPYASHQPILAAYAQQIKKGRIIEYGVGDYSTGMLHEICKKNENTLISIDNNKQWLDKVATQYPGFHWHEYVFVSDYTDLLDIRHDFACDLAFIDGATWGTRLFCLGRTMSNVHGYKTVIVHDCDFIVGGHREYLPVMKNYYIEKRVWPPTLVIGDKIAIDYDLEAIE
jgi:hypothetical protein